MKAEQQIKAVAELDGWRTVKNDGGAGGFIAISPQGNFSQKLYASPEQALIQNGQPYMVSRDAIVPVIEKQSLMMKVQIIDFLCEQVVEAYDGSDYIRQSDMALVFCATAAQLSEALLRATEKWIE